MFLKLKRKSPLPIHVQLRAQLVHLIQSGRWAPGTRLPTVRRLAGTLNINRNTVSKVFAELERGGYLSCERGRGTFVSPRGRRENRQKLRELLAAADEAARTARRLGFVPTDFAATLYARAVSQGVPRTLKAPVLFVECNRWRLHHLSRQLAEALPARVDSLLIEDLRRMARRSPASLRKYGLVVTTLFHAHEVRTLLAKTGLEVVGLLAHASQATLARLAALPAGTKVGMAAYMKASLRALGLTHLRLVGNAGRGARSLRPLLRKASVVVCSRPLARQLRRRASRGTEILADDWRLDRAGVEMVRQRLLERMV